MNEEERAAADAICGVVVTYHPDPEVVDNVVAMLRECGQVIVVDNGSAPHAIRPISALPGVEVMALADNAGLATALNFGAARAMERGYSWIVAFDQDSRPEAGMVSAQWALHQRLPVASVIGPRIEESGASRGSYRWVRAHPHWPGCYHRSRVQDALDEVTMVVTSGSLIELAFWKDTGRFDESLFIDYIDIDYCLRVIRAGRTVAVAGTAVLQHRLGARQERVVLGIDLRPMNHAPFRHYYMARNRVTMWRRHAWAMPHWAAFDLSFALYNYTRVLLFERERWAKIKSILRGTWHGLRGVTGPMPS